MATPKYIALIEDGALDDIANWAARGCTNQEIASNLGVHRSTFREWVKEIPSISDALKKGRLRRDVCVENAFFRKAVGQCEESTEVVDESYVVRDGEPVMTSRTVRRTVRRVPPDTAAMIFYLKNHLGYADAPQVKVDVESVPTFVFSRDA